MVDRVVEDSPFGPLLRTSDERTVSLVESRLQPPSTVEHPLTVILQMAGVASADQLGSRGPVIAALADAANAANPEARRLEARFGRDAATVAKTLRRAYPQLADGTVRYFYALQAPSADYFAQSRAGMFPNHVRDPGSPLARELTARDGRHWPWYGGSDQTPMLLEEGLHAFLRNPAMIDEVARYPEGLPRAGRVVEHDGRPLTLGQAAVNAARHCLDALTDQRGPFLLWAHMNLRDSYTVWTDSPNAFAHRDGRLGGPPVAPLQMQGQMYDTLLLLAEVVRERGLRGLSADQLLDVADRVKATVLSEDGFVVAPSSPDNDGRGLFLANAVEPRPGRLGAVTALAQRTVNMGLFLGSRMLDGEEHRELREATAAHLFSPSMLGPFGIFGRAEDEVTFSTWDYHAQVWPHACHEVARNFAARGWHAAARELDARVMRTTRDGLLLENLGASHDPQLQPCPVLWTVERVAANGATVRTVKARTPAPRAAWQAAAVVDIQDSLSRPLPDAAAADRAVDARLLAAIPGAERAYRTDEDLRWAPADPQDAPLRHGSARARHVESAHRDTQGRDAHGPQLPQRRPAAPRDGWSSFRHDRHS